MKNIVIIALVTVLFITKGFGQKYVIYGTTANHLSYKYAYLYDSDTKIFITEPIVDHQFSFKVDKIEKPKILLLSFNTELFKSYKQVLESPDYKYPNGSRMVALEDTVKVTLKEYTKDAIVEGKILNKDIDDMNIAINSRKYDAFFEQHPDSFIAIMFLKILSKYTLNGLPVYTIQERKLSYDKLSDRLKQSDEGKELLAMIMK